MISTVNEYITEIEGLNIPDSDMTSTTLPWYRGQSDSRWDLMPSMYRGDWDYEREREMARDFRLRALIDIEHKPRTYLGWLFVMQHHGLATRLLDWTESSLVALYFAVEDYNKDSDAIVWVFHPWKLNESQESYGQSSVPQMNKEIDENYSYPTHTIPCPTIGPPKVQKELPMALRPAHTTRRIIAQRGQFTIHGNEPIGLNQIPKTRIDLNLKKLLIRKDSKMHILQELYRLGVTRHSLFPDLDGLAKEIAIRYSNDFMV